MTNENMNMEDQLKGAHIGDVRALAKRYGIKSQRDWDKTKFIEEILKAQATGDLPDLSTDDAVDEEAEQLIANYSLPAARTASASASGNPKPGYARIILHKDATPGHANSPVPVGLNGMFKLIPRGVACDVPIEFLGVLRDAVQIRETQTAEPDGRNNAGTWTKEEILSYPYQIVALTPGGKFKNSEDQRSASAHRRKAFHDELQRWPTEGELHEWEKAMSAAERAAKVAAAAKSSH